MQKEEEQKKLFPEPLAIHVPGTKRIPSHFTAFPSTGFKQLPTF